MPASEENLEAALLPSPFAVPTDDAEEDEALREKEGQEEELALQEDLASAGTTDLTQVMRGETRLTQATANLATTIIGAGIMALPKAFGTLGIVLGMACLAGIFVLSLFSLNALVRVSRMTHHWTYHEAVEAEFGRPGLLALKVAIIINNAGSMIVYLIIIGDVLVGVPPDYNGLITNLVGLHDPSVWFVSRPFVLAVACLLVLAPLLSLRDLGRLGPMSTAGVVIAGGFATSVVAVTGIAIFKGQIGDFHWLPTDDMLGHTWQQKLVNLLAVLPVISLSFICHYNVHPIAHSLERFSNRRMRMVINRALVVCTCVFTLVAAGGYCLFGSHTQANILNNLTPEGLAPIIGVGPGRVLSFAVRLGYCTCLMATFAMLNWALRETLSKLLFGTPMLPGPGFFVLSYCVLALLYVVAILVPSVWTAMSVTGATAATFVAFILPGMLLLRVGGRSGRLSVRSATLACVCVGLGITMGVVTLANTFWLSRRS